MILKLKIFWAILLVVSISIVWVGFSLLKTHNVFGRWDAFGKHSRSRNERVYMLTPFYFPFRAAATSMHTTLAFSEQSEYKARHNSQGFRSPEYTTAHPPDTFRILVLGDSYTWGQGVKMEETYHFRAAKIIRKLCSGFQIEVISGGVCGHRFADHLIKLLVHGTSLNPDLVVIQICPNDVDFFDYLGIFHFQGLANPFQSYRRKETEVYARGSLDRNVFSEALSEIRKWSNKNKVPVSFLVFPIFSTSKKSRNFNNYDPRAYETVPQLAQFESIVEEVRESGFPTLYLLDTFREEAGNQFLAVSENDAHPNPTAHRIAADGLVSFLFDEEKIIHCSGFLPPAADPRWKKENELRLKAGQDWKRFHTDVDAKQWLYEQLRSLYPENAWITMQLGVVYNEQKKWKESYDTFKAISRLNPEHAAPWFHMAETLYGVPEKTLLLEKMHQYVPDHYYTLKNLSEHYIADRKPELACRLLKRQLEIPTTADEYRIARTLFEQHCSDE